MTKLEAVKELLRRIEKYANFEGAIVRDSNGTYGVIALTTLNDVSYTGSTHMVFHASKSELDEFYGYDPVIQYQF